jgi:hypothetical protein
MHQYTSRSAKTVAIDYTRIVRLLHKNVLDKIYLLKLNVFCMVVPSFNRYMNYTE